MIWALLAGCHSIEGTGDAPAEAICGWASQAWRGGFENVCDADSPRGVLSAEACYESLTVSVEPMDVDPSAGTLQLAACFRGNAAVYLGPREVSVGTWAGAADDLPGYLTADDGLMPCFGLTARLDGDFQGGAGFAPSSYWWDNGDQPGAWGKAADGEIGPLGATLSLNTPTLKSNGFVIDLGLPDLMDLELGDFSHFATPAHPVCAGL